MLSPLAGDYARESYAEAHPVRALLDLPEVDPGSANAHQDLSSFGPRRVYLTERQHLARGTAAFVPGSSHSEASSFSPVTAHSIAKPRASTSIIHRTSWKVVSRKLI
jgi:hypothetical protein